ncbi:MAG: peptide ABC transporter substrate-binding protein [Candidatus Velthaea sp.]
MASESGRAVRRLHERRHLTEGTTLNKTLALLLAAGLLAGCTKVPDTASPSAGNAAAVPSPGARHSYTRPHELRYSTAEDIVGLNPHLVQQTVVGYMASLTMAWLTKFDHENRPVPELTTEVPTQQNGGISADGKTITWHLRKDAKWSDGVPFTADDVAFSTSVVLNPKNNEVGRDGWDLIAKVDVPDKYTAVFHLKKPYAAYITTFFSSAGANPCILPKHLLADLPDINNAKYNQLPVGIGPFKYKLWKRSDFVELVPDPLYFRGQPKLQKITFRIVPDRNTVLAQLQGHEIDLWTPVTFAYYDRVRAISGLTVLKQPSLYFDHLDFENKHPGLDDPQVRAALRYAVDRDEIKRTVHHGLGVVQDDVVSPANPAFDKNVPTTPFDLAKAKQLLDGAGWAPGPDGIRAKDGRRLSFTWATSTGAPDTDQIIELIRANWKPLGVEVQVKHFPTPLFFAPMQSGGIVYGDKWDFITFAWGGDVIADLSNLYECKQAPPNGQNDPRYCNPKVDEAMEKFKLEYDAAKRQQYSDFIQEQIAKDAPVIVLDVREDIYAFNSDLKGFAPNQVSQFDDFMNVDI